MKKYLDHSLYLRPLRAVLFAFLLSGAALSGESVTGTCDSEKARFRLISVADGLERPWGMAFLPEGLRGSDLDISGGILITERTGGLKLILGEQIIDIEGIPRVASVGQGGLLDIALHPEFERNKYIYFSYSASYGFGYGTRLGRGRLVGEKIEDFEVLFSMERPTRVTRHFGSRLAFGGDGTLYFSIGDRGDRTRAPDLGQHAGKILRINDDGSTPADNPFLDVSGALPEIFSFGHRNAQGLIYDEMNATIWAHEHGPQGGDEVNIVRGGVNYGWPEITYGREYSGAYIAPTSKPGLEQPIIYWVPSIAPSGLAMYRSDAFPEWNGNLFAGALAGQELRRMVVEGNEIVHQETLLKNQVGRIRDVREGPDGNLWILIDDARGKLIRIEPAG